MGVATNRSAWRGIGFPSAPAEPRFDPNRWQSSKPDRGRVAWRRRPTPVRPDLAVGQNRRDLKLGQPLAELSSPILVRTAQNSRRACEKTWRGKTSRCGRISSRSKASATGPTSLESPVDRREIWLARQEGKTVCSTPRAMLLPSPPRCVAPAATARRRWPSRCP
jgi:hypothetical protein